MTDISKDTNQNNIPLIAKVLLGLFIAYGLFTLFNGYILWQKQNEISGEVRDNFLIGGVFVVLPVLILLFAGKVMRIAKK